MIWQDLTFQLSYAINILVTVRNKSDTLQETTERYTPNEEYKNFVTADIEWNVEFSESQ